MVTPIRIFVVLIFVGSAYNFVIKRTWDNWRMRNIQKRLDCHVVVCGFGTSGSEAVKELVARGTPAQDIVVIDTDEDSLAIAEAMGCNVLAADATRDETLIQVKVDRARSTIVSAGRDDASILIVLTVRHLAPRRADQRRRAFERQRNCSRARRGRPTSSTRSISPGCCSPDRRMASTSPSTWPTSPASTAASS